MTRNLAGKRVLVTGASRTLGRVIALELAERGADLALNYFRSHADAEKLAERIRAGGGRAVTVQGDMSSYAEARRVAAAAAEALGGVDILVHNAGPYDDRPFLELPEEKWREVFDANCTALYALAQELAPGMIASGWGRMIAIGAGSALMRSHSVYGLAKAALVHLCEALAVELAPAVTVNAISPGLIADNEDMSPEFVRESAEDTPLKRLVTRAEVAGLVAALSGAPYDMVTGQNIVMDGGRTIPTRG